MPATQTLPHWLPQRPRYIDKTQLPPTPSQKILAYLYMRQAPVSWTTLRIVVGVSRDDATSTLTRLVGQGLVKRVARGQYVMGKVPLPVAHQLIAAVHYVPARWWTPGP